MFAFQITEEDVRTVVAKMDRYDIAADDNAVTAIFSKLDGDIVEKSILYGNDIETQTDYALEEIERQIKKLGLLP